MNGRGLLCMLLTGGSLCAQFPDFGGAPLEGEVEYGDSRDQVKVEVTPSRTRVAPGDELVIAVTFSMEPNWKIYAGDQPMPEEYYRTRIVAEAAEESGLVAYPRHVQWPAHKVIEFFGEELPVYEGTATVYLPVLVREDAAPGEASLVVRPVFQSCDDRICLAPTPLPPERGRHAAPEWVEYGHTVTIEIVPAGEIGAEDRVVDEELFGAFEADRFDRIRSGAPEPEMISFGLFELNVAGAAGLVLLWVVAMAGGLILNMTPCVLPVIPIKIMSLSQQAASRAKCFSLGVAMGLGVIGLWLAIGSTIAVFGYFTSTNELFQHPPFAIGIGVIIAVMAVAMSGLFSLNLPNWVYRVNPSHDSYHGSFGFGIMTGILALPCTAPFMGAAIAIAATFTPTLALTVFAAIGVGQALPYVVLAAFPRLVKRIPRAGPASDLVKQVMGLLMLGAAAFFLGIGLSAAFVSPPDPPSRVYWWAVAFFVVLGGLWLGYKTFSITPSLAKRVVFGGLGVALAGAALYGAGRLTDRGPIPWTYYTAERLDQALSDGEVVVLEFTAEWCLNCKFLERTVLFTGPVIEALAASGVHPMKVDLTGNNPHGNELLNRMGRRSIPLLVVIDPNAGPVLAEDWYTQGQVLQAIEQAKASAEVLLSR
jgi:cytochrome c biogenesis protein CcdA